MTKRKTSVRALSLLLALCLVVGILPVSAFSVETTVSGAFTGADRTHYMMFATDRHANNTIIGNLLTLMETAIGGGVIEYVGLGGDMVGEGSGDNPTYDVNDVLLEVTAVASNLDSSSVDLVYASGHDQGWTDPSSTGIMNITSGQLYEGEDYYVYGVIEDDVKTASNAQTAAAAFVTWANGIDTDKVIIVLSHFPLHALRGDNLGAGYWHTALNSVAVGTGVSEGTIIRDVVFFHGHNHSQETTTYLQGPKTTLSIENLSAASSFSVASMEAMVVYDYEAETYANASGTEDTIYYTYATAGYLNAQSKATLFSIDSDSFTLTEYNTSGATGNTLTVDRVSSGSAVPVTLEVTGASEYALGDTFVSPTVTVKYSDNTSKTVTDYTVTGTVNTDAEGTYTLTYGYTEGDYAATVVFTVNVVSNVKTVTYEDALTVITATSEGLTGITVTDAYNEENPIAAFGKGYYVVHDIDLVGYTAGNSVTYTIEVEEGVDTSAIELYYVNEDGTVESLNYTTSTRTEDGYEYVMLTFTTDKVGTFAYGTPVIADEIPEGATLSSLTVTGPTKTIYFLETDTLNGNVYLNIAGLKVIANYTLDGEVYSTTLDWNQFDETIDGYALAFDDLTTYGEKTVTVTYGSQSYQFKVWVCTRGETDMATTVSVAFDTPCAVSVAVAETAVTADLSAWVANYVAYDVSVNYANGYTALQGTATVTLPIPEGVTKPVVLYVSDDGATVEKMTITESADSTVTFETSHFSSYVVGDSTEIEVPAHKTEDVTTTTTTKTTKTVYVLTSSISSGTSYLIVNSNSAGDRYALANNSGSAAATGVTVKSGDVDGDGDAETYIELVDATDELWTVGSGYTFKNGSYYLGYSTSSSGGNFGNAGNTTYTLALESTSTNWNWSSTYNRLSFSVNSNNNGGPNGDNNQSRTYYLCYSSGWGINTNSNSVYFYAPTEIEEETTTTVSGTYSIEGNPPEVSQGVETIVDTETNTTVYTVGTLDYAIKFTDGSGNVKTLTTEEIEALGGTVTLTTSFEDANGDTINGDPVGIIKSTEGNTVTYTGTCGTALVKITYTWIVGEGDDAKTYSIDNYIRVTTTEPVWDLDLVAPVWTAATEYKSGTAYYTQNADGSYTQVSITEFAENTTYYTLSYNSITKPIIIKDVEDGQNYSNVWAVITKNGEDIGKLSDSDLEKLTFISSNTDIATVDGKTGKVTFTGASGTVMITAIYEYADGKYVTDTVAFSVSDDHYYIPEDGTDDFPEYPNEGAIRFDKTATAVGNFSETGITQVELSMTGVPYTVGNEMDVVVMLDMTGSMSSNGMTAAEEATKAFVELIVKNEDGSYNDNRVAVYAFNSGSSSPYELVSLKTIKSDAELATANTAIETASTKQSQGGTPFSEATQKVYNVLQAAKTTNLPDGITSADDYKRQQFCVFMSDGGPTTYYGSDEKTYYGGNGSGDVTIASKMTNYTSTDSSTWSMDLPTEYYTDLMKSAGVTVYTVGLLLQNAPSNPAPWSAMTGVSSVYNSTTDTLTTVGTHYYFTSSILKKMATDESKYIDIFNVDNADNATAKFKSIAQSILDAAKDVKVEDKMTDAFTMVFEAPNAVVDAEDGGQEYYIEVKEYALNAVDNNKDGVTDDYTRGTGTSKLKLYLGTNTNVTPNTYYAATANGSTNGSNTYASPVFATTALGSKYYWTTDSAKATSGISVTISDTTYYFTKNGDGTHNMTSGAYAYGTITEVDIINSQTNEKTGTNATSNDLIIATPYFVYNAATKVLVWTVDELSNTELALSYFLYLDHSGGWEGSDQAVEPGTYETNEYADLTYTNFKENECEQELPVPQITWNGAQVSYVFYLVNKDGQPVNRAGRVVPFSEAVYVTDVFTYSITWNDLEMSTGLEANRLAEDLVPEVYELYDSGAQYKIHVYEDEKETNLNNHFVIAGTAPVNTTYVFNTKADDEKYSAPGTYITNDGNDSTNTTTYLCKSSGAVTVEYNADGSVNSASYVLQTGEAAKSFESDPGCDYFDSSTGYAYYTDENGDWYVIVQRSDATEVRTGFDFSNTTVAFAVIWTPELVEDVVVIDYGLDVVIDVTTNDALSSGVVGVRTDAPSDIDINKGQYTAAKVLSTDVMIGDLKVGTATVESLTSIRFSLDKNNGMQLTEPVVFYYESDVNFYSEYSVQSENTLHTTSMYSSVTVIPATTIYYEDSFVELSVTGTAEWTVEGTAINATQAQDRPGESDISAALDADNLYGYDGAYTNMSTYSMGSARKVTVSSGNAGRAAFTFYGTGFDVISLTSDTTGNIIVKVYAVATDGTRSEVRSKTVDTYYGMLDDGTLAENSPDTLYQVPVMKITDLPYGKYYVTITASYNYLFDHDDNGSYDFYLDAIRIYDPTGVVSGSDTGDTDGIVSGAYTADGEASPIYQELRNNIIKASDTGVLPGVVFIDCNDETFDVADYTNHGPNNELYLASDQAIMFVLSEENKDLVASLQIGMKSATGETVNFYIFDAATVEDADDLEGLKMQSFKTATDMYYDITDLIGKTVVIYNDGAGILSITNLKETFKQAATASALATVDYNAILALLNVLSSEEEEPSTESTEPESGETDSGTETESSEATESSSSTGSDSSDEEQGNTQKDKNTIKERIQDLLEKLRELFGSFGFGN